MMYANSRERDSRMKTAEPRSPTRSIHPSVSLPREAKQFQSKNASERSLILLQTRASDNQYVVCLSVPLFQRSFSLHGERSFLRALVSRVKISGDKFPFQSRTRAAENYELQG